MRQQPPALPTSGKMLPPKKLSVPEIPPKMVFTTIKSSCAPFEVETYGKGDHALYFLPEANSELAHIVQFGKRRASNAYEQQFIGLGHAFVDTDGILQIVVTRIIPIVSASRGPTHAKVASEGNDSMLEVLENERKIQNDLEGKFNSDDNGYTIDPFLDFGPSTVVLFGHTHPDLGCFFSAVDHRSNYSTPTVPIVTFVCDPIRKEMQAMVGSDCQAMTIVVCRPRDPLSGGAPRRAGSVRDGSVDELWQRVSATANMLLLHAGVNGSFDCHHDWRGRAHMKFKITYRPSRRSRRD